MRLILLIDPWDPDNDGGYTCILIMQRLLEIAKDSDYIAQQCHIRYNGDVRDHLKVEFSIYLIDTVDPVTKNAVELDLSSGAFPFAKLKRCSTFQGIPLMDYLPNITTRRKYHPHE